MEFAIDKLEDLGLRELAKQVLEKDEEIFDLKDEIERLNNIIKEVREYIEEDYDRNEEVVDYCGFKEFYKHILEILDKEKE